MEKLGQRTSTVRDSGQFPIHFRSFSHRKAESRTVPRVVHWHCSEYEQVESSWNVMAHGDAREGKWRGNWRIERVAWTLTLPRNMVYPALLPLMRTPRLPVVDWTDAPADLTFRHRASSV